MKNGIKDMRKQILAALLIAASTIPATAVEVITTPPTGDTVKMTRTYSSVDAYGKIGLDPGVLNNRTVDTEVIYVGDKDVYFKNFVTTDESFPSFYVKGVKENGKIRVDFPQGAWDNPDFGIFSIDCMTIVDPSKVSKGYNIVSSDNYVTYTIGSDGSLTLDGFDDIDATTPQRIIGISYDDFGTIWYGMGDFYQKWTPAEPTVPSEKGFSFSLSVDNPANVDVYPGSVASGTPFTLTAGSNALKLAEGETTITISAHGNSKLKSVILDGESVAVSEEKSATVTIHEGSRVDITTARIPEGDKVPVELKFVNEDTQGFVTRVTLNGEDVAEWQKGFEAPHEATIELYVDRENFTIYNIKYNGGWVNYYSDPISIALTSDEANLITIEVVKNPMIPFTLNLDDASHVVVYKGYMQTGEPYEGLKDGDNHLEIGQRSLPLTIVASSGFFITSANVDGTPVTSIGADEYRVDKIMENSVVTVRTSPIMNRNVTLWIKNRNDAMSIIAYDKEGHTWSYKEDNEEGINTLKEGYNLLEGVCNTGFTIEPSNPVKGVSRVLYVNGQKADVLSLSQVGENDVLKLFLNFTPEVYKVELSCDDPSAEIVMDRARKLEETTGIFRILEGSEMQITAPDATVFVDGKATDKTDGKVNLAINGDCQIDIKKNSGISVIESGTDKVAPVYNLQGMEVGTSDKFENLPSGIYIINGKKVKR